MILIMEQGETNWIPIISAIISFLAVCVAILSIWLQHWQYQKKREPIISPTTKSFDVELPELGLDWENGDRLDPKFSNTSIPIYNFGGTTAHNIVYSFRLVNLLTLKEQLDQYNYDVDTYAKIENVNSEYTYFDLVIGYNSSVRRFNKIKSFIRRSDLISSGEKIDILLPSYFVILINLKYKVLTRFIDEIDDPVLELTVRYSDVSNNNYIAKYQVTLDYQCNVKTLQYERVRLSSNFVHEFISRKKIK